MPELPEVETIRRQLSTLTGFTITSIEVRPSKVIRGDLSAAHGAAIKSADRYGKLLLIHLSNHYSLAIHLKMTGRLTLLTPSNHILLHTHVTVHFTNGQRLSFADTRRFGYVSIHHTDDLAALPFLKTLGKEPLKDLRREDFATMLGRSRRAIKVLLLDQTKIAGIGNIYACEALWMARISPTKLAQEISEQESERLFTAIEAVLQEGIDRGGASDNTYRDLLGQKGNYQDFFKVYGRAGKECRRCGHMIRRSTLAGRGTFFCPTCQRLEK